MHCWPFSIILKNELLFTISITIICTKVISRDYFIQFMWPIAYMKNNFVGNTILFSHEPVSLLSILLSLYDVFVGKKNYYSSLFLIAIFPNRTQIIVSLSHFPKEKNTICSSYSLAKSLNIWVKYIKILNFFRIGNSPTCTMHPTRYIFWKISTFLKDSTAFFWVQTL